MHFPFIRRIHASLPHDVRRLTSNVRNPRAFREWQALRCQQNADGYSFAPFDQLRCIFIHIPKCAGISVSKTLFGNLGGGHRRVDQYRLIFRKRQFQDYFKFTFVRNPWDRLVSAFFYMKRGGFSESDRRWAEQTLSEFSDFDSFVRGWLNPVNIRSTAMFMPQTHFYCIDGKSAVNFVGSFENLNADFHYVSERLGVNADLPKLNETRSTRQNYRTYYGDETRQIVAEVYREDIQALGYTFDNANRQHQNAFHGAA